MNAEREAVRIAYEAMRAKDAWMQACGDAHLPPAITRAIRARSNLHFCAYYLQRHGFQEHLHANGWRYFVRDGLYLGAFRFLIADGKATTTAVVFPEPLAEIPAQFKEQPKRGAFYPASDV